jgi:hypothetical protein
LFLAVLLDPNHPEHVYMQEWAGYWTLELSDWLQKAKGPTPLVLIGQWLQEGLV